MYVKARRGGFDFWECNCETKTMSEDRRWRWFRLGDEEEEDRSRDEWTRCQPRHESYWDNNNFSTMWIQMLYYCLQGRQLSYSMVLILCIDH